MDTYIHEWRKKPRLHTGNERLGNEERRGGNEEREERRSERERPECCRHTSNCGLFCPLQRPPRGRPAKWTHKKPKKPKKHRFSLTSKFLPPRRKRLPGAGAQGLLPPCRGTPRLARGPSPSQEDPVRPWGLHTTHRPALRALREDRPSPCLKPGGGLTGPNRRHVASSISPRTDAFGWSPSRSPEWAAPEQLPLSCPQPALGTAQVPSAVGFSACLCFRRFQREKHQETEKGISRALCPLRAKCP